MPLSYRKHPRLSRGWLGKHTPTIKASEKAEICSCMAIESSVSVASATASSVSDKVAAANSSFFALDFAVRARDRLALLPDARDAIVLLLGFRV